MLQFVCLLLLPALVHGQTPRVCHLGKDIALVFDISSNKTEEEQLNLRSFGQKMVDLANGHAETQLAIIAYDPEARERVTLKKWSMSEARDEIFNVFAFWDSSTSQTHRAMDLINTFTFSIEYGARPDIDNVTIILTDRPSSDPAEAAFRAARLKNGGTKVYVVIIGDDSLRNEALNYATSIDHILSIDSFESLPVEFNSLQQLAFNCWPCPNGWISRGVDLPFCYLLVSDMLSWEGARANCMATQPTAGSDLISFSSDDQVTWVKEEFFAQGPNQMAWIGLSRSSTSAPFVYTDGTTLDTTIVSWKANNPKNSLCVGYGYQGMLTKPCTSARKSICVLRKDNIP